MTEPEKSTPEEISDIRYHHEVLGPYAAKAKGYIQMLIGASLFFLLLTNALTHLFSFTLPAPLTPIGTTHPLTLVSWGLMYGAGVELCYLLFTDGPDEALNPIILGLASAVLLIVSREPFEWWNMLLVPLLILCMGALFWLNEQFYPKRRS